MGRTGLINAKVHATKSRQNFSLRTHPIHTMGPEAQVFIAFPKVWVHYDRFVIALNLVQMGHSGAINAKVRATKSRLNLSLRTRSVHTNGL